MHGRWQAELTSETVENNGCMRLRVGTYPKRGLGVPGGRRRSRGGALRIVGFGVRWWNMYKA